MSIFIGLALLADEANSRLSSRWILFGEMGSIPELMTCWEIIICFVCFIYGLKYLQDR